MGISRKHYGCPGIPFFNKTGQASSDRPGELGYFHLKQEITQKPLEGPRFKNYYLHPYFSKYTPFVFFGDSFSVMISGMSRDFTYCATKGAKYVEAVSQRLHAIKQ